MTGRATLLFSLLALVRCTREPTPSTVPDVQAESESAPANPVEPAEVPGLTRDEIRLVVRAKLPEVRACFEAGLAEGPELRGRVTLRFTIGPEGRILDPIAIEDEIGGEVVECLREGMQGWQFPLPVGGREVAVVYPFNFSSQESLRSAGLPRVEGTLRPERVGEVFTDHQAELDACVVVRPGSIGVALTIDDAGTVTKIAPYQSTLDQASTRCVVRTIASWTFPAAAEGDEAKVNHDLEW